MFGRQYLQPTFRIQSVEVDTSAMTVHIAGVRDGIVAALLRVLGIGTTANWTIDSNGAASTTSRFSGESTVYCPLPNVASSLFELTKPVQLLVIAATLVFIGLPQLFVEDTGVAVGIVFILIAIGCLVRVSRRLERCVYGSVCFGGTGRACRCLSKIQGATAVFVRHSDRR